MKKRYLKKLALIMLVILLSACNMPTSSPSPAEQTAIIDRSVAETIAAGSDGEIGDGDPTLTATADPGADITATPTPTITPEPDTPTPSITPIPCNLGRFITDVTVPDGTEYEPGEVFTKTWRIKNTGSCAWTSGYDIVFSGGDAMSAPSSIQITSGTVNPGQSVDVSVELTAPATDGTYRGNWQLRDPSDVIFGIENSTSGFFWVEIEVKEIPAPISVTLQTSNLSYFMSVSGRSQGIRAGIASNGDAIRAFVDFDLSSLAGLDSNSIIQSAALDVSNHDGFACFDFLHPLKAGQIKYGSTPQYPADFNESPSATLFNVPSALGISAPINIKNILQDFVDSNGAAHFQFRMWLDGDDAGAGYACMMEWTDPTLSITYLP